MDPLLTALWIDRDEETIPIVDDASVALAREAVRRVGGETGLARPDVEAAAIVVSELARNHLVHARGGRVAVRRVARGGVPGIEIVAADRGAGIADVEGALAGGASSAGTMGAGLSGARRLAHEMDLDVRLGEGTCVWARVFAERLARAPEVAILCRPCRGERVAGDHAVFVREGERLTLGVIDGLGHGEQARHASDRAAETIRARVSSPLAELVAACDAALAGTRGAVLSLVRLDGGYIDHVGVGNVTTRVERRAGSRSFAGPAFVLGAPRPSRRVVEERAALGPREVVLAFTDGLATRTSLGDDASLANEAPMVIAARLFARHARDNDDALILVVK